MPIHVHHEPADMAPIFKINREDHMTALAVALEQCVTLNDAMTLWSEFWANFQSALRRPLYIRGGGYYREAHRMIEARCTELRGHA